MVQGYKRIVQALLGGVMVQVSTLLVLLLGVVIDIDRLMPTVAQIVAGVFMLTAPGLWLLSEGTPQPNRRLILALGLLINILLYSSIIYVVSLLMTFLLRLLLCLVLISTFICFASTSVSALERPRPSALEHGVQTPTQTEEANALLRQAYELFQQRKYDEALALCAKAKTLAPRDFGPYAMTAGIYRAQQKLKPASDEWAEAIRLQPDKKELYLAKAEVDLLRNAPADAIAAARKATEVDPTYAAAFAMLAQLLGFEKANLAEKVAALRTVIKLKPQLLRTYADLGRILLNAKDEKGAEEVYRQGLEADPAHMAGRFDLARILVDQGRLKEARALWEGRSSDDDRTHPQLIEVLTWAENRQRATEALAQKPNDPETLIDMGLAVMEGPSWVVDGREEKALVYLRKALTLKPDSARAQSGIVKAYVQIASTFDKAKPDVERELAKLRRLDAKLADEMEEFRKQYHSPLSVPAGPRGPVGPTGPSGPPR